MICLTQIQKEIFAIIYSFWCCNYSETARRSALFNSPVFSRALIVDNSILAIYVFIVLKENFVHHHYLPGSDHI